MTASQARAGSGRAGALLGAIAVLAAGCAAAGGGSGRPPAAQAASNQGSVAASPAGRVVAHRTAGDTGPGMVRHGSGPGIARGSSPGLCAPPVGDPVANQVGAASGSTAAVPMCLCCWGCACAWACCGCGPGPWPPRWPAHSRLAWECCARWQQRPGWRTSPVPVACEPGCSSPACPLGPPAPVPGPARAAAGSVQDRSPGRLSRPA